MGQKRLTTVDGMIKASLGLGGADLAGQVE